MDLETDSKIQQTIQTQFKDKTLLCIARMLTPTQHVFLLTLSYIDRLRTIISYDRILVMDAGQVAVRARLPFCTGVLPLTFCTGIRHAAQPVYESRRYLPRHVREKQHLPRRDPQGVPAGAGCMRL